MKLKKTYQLLIFIFLSNSIVAQNNFYIEVNPNSEETKFLEKLESLSETKIDSFNIFEDSDLPLTQAGTKLHLKIKKKNKKLKLPSYRIYFHTSLTYDTLTILGVSRNYDNQIYSEDGIDSPSQLWIVPLVEYQQFATKEDYKKVTKTLYELTSKYYKNYNPTTPFNSVSFTLNDNFKILSSSFYLFTCGEVYLFKDPYDEGTELRRTVHDFILQDSYNSYEDFSIPEELHFSFQIKLKNDSAVSGIKNYGCLKLNSNLKFIFEYDNIGATYTRKSETKTFWANREYVFNYLDRDNVFQESMNLFFKSALYNTLKNK